MPKKIDYGFTPSEYQEKVFEFVRKGVGNGVIRACAGSGKCLGYDTEILMYDGSIKKVQDIVVGDLLMGDDSTPRTVLSTTKGKGKLKRIVPKKGESWVCNDVHILTLSKYFHGRNNEKKGYYETVDLSIDSEELKTALKHNDGDYRNYKLLKTGVEFPHKDVLIDPWLYGIWIGDGTTGESEITNVDEEIIEEIKECLPENHYTSIKQYDDKSPRISILCESHKKYANVFRQFIRKSSNENGKFINTDYLINDRDVRLKLLAGIIDSDGYYNNNNYYISTKSKKLCKDIVFLARSLGLGANFSYGNKKCYNTGTVRKYYHIIINGDLTQIPVILTRKRATERLIKKNPLHIGFRIEDNGYGDYYGFELDGNGRFLLGDFTITHNTTTIITAMKLVPKSRKCLFIAFNKSIVEELTKKLEGYQNCSVRTLHSLGYAMIRRNLGNNIEINEYKYRVYLKSNLCELSGISEDIVLTQKEVEQYTENIISLIDFARFNNAQTVGEIYKVALNYDIPVSFDECEVALKCLEWGKENTNVIDYTDMLWLPYELSLKPVGLQYDWIFFDEAQDASLMAIQLFLKCFKRGTRFVAVGDPNQAINMFAGSSPEAFSYLCDYKDTTVFDLPITYRCSKNVTKFANFIVKEIMPREDAVDGIVENDCHVKDIKDGDMVLSRSRTPLLKLYVKLLRRGVNCYIKGQDIGANLIKLLEDIDTDMLNANLMGDGVFIRLYEKLFEERDEQIVKRGLDLVDATLTPGVMNLYDSINALSVLAERCKTKKELIKKISGIFKEQSDGVCLSTIHKAKGLEAQNVYILCHSSMPSRLAKHDWEKLQERNLQYVAYTRPKYKLGFVSEEEIKPSGSLLDPGLIMDELEHIERRVCEVLGKEMKENVTYGEYAKFRANKMAKIEETEPEENGKTVEEPKEKKKNGGFDILASLSDFLSKDEKNIDKLKQFLSNG